MPGTLYLIPCPIAEEGDVWDVLPAANRAVMASLDYFIVENTRSARRFLSKAKLGRPIEELEFRELNEHTVAGREVEELVAPIAAGRSAGVISEAGVPGVADPGALVVALCHRRGIRVVPLVGPSSILLAMMVVRLQRLPARQTRRTGAGDPRFRAARPRGTGAALHRDALPQREAGRTTLAALRAADDADRRLRPYRTGGDDPHAQRRRLAAVAAAGAEQASGDLHSGVAGAWYTICAIEKNRNTKQRDMKKEEVYNEAIGGDEGFAPGEGYPSCDGQPCANVSGDDGVATDTMTDATPTGDEGPSDGAASGEAGEESGVEAGGSEQLAPELERRIAEWQDKYLRLQAEFDNYRKRTLREKMELVERGGADVIKAMLPVADDMDRAVEAMAGSDDIEALRAGVGLIAQKFHEVLRSCGVSEIEAKGLELDTDHHEAVARFQAGEEQRGKIVDVVQKGYRLRDKVLRFAKVVVGE